jgi:diguanylate cyclase (GGDEF)-like protein/PAS domain S-box-containing protein
MIDNKDDLDKTREELIKELAMLRSRASDGEQKMRAIFDQTYQFIGLMTPDGVLIEANKTALDFIGNDASEVLGKLFWETPWWTHSPEMQEKLRLGVKTAAAGEFVRFEATHPAQNGSLRHIDFSIKPVKDQGGRVIYLIPEGRDITQRKEIEERLKETQAELEIRVKVRTAELTKVNEDLHREIVERKRIEDLLKNSEANYRAIIEDQTEMICRFLPNGAIVFVNNAYCRYFKKTRDELIGRLFEPVILEEDRKKIDEIMGGLTKEHPVTTQESRIIDSRERLCWIQWTARAIFDEDDKLAGYQVVGRDVTEQKTSAQALEKQKRFLSSIFSSIQDGICVLDKDMNIVRVNPVMEKWYAYNMPLVGKKCYAAYHGANAPCKICPTIQTIKSGEPAFELSPKRDANGKIAGWLDLFSFPLFDENTKELIGAIEYVRDITSRKQAEEDRERLYKELASSNRKLEQIALMDTLTGLYNQRYLEKVIEGEFHRAKRYANPLSVIMVDIDYFKSINEVYGFDFGDLVLKQFSVQLKKLVRKYDIVIRFGGEEFVILSPGSGRPETLGLAQRLLDTLSLYHFGDKKHKVRLKLSLAVASYPEDRTVKGMDLINGADKILFKVKEFGGNKVYSSLDTSKTKYPELRKGHGKRNIKILKDEINKLTRKANQSPVEAIFAFAKTIELKDHYTGEHVENTVKYATEIGKALNLSKDEIELVKQAAMLHDLGKIGIPENILLKKSKLTKKEFSEIKKHPQIGADIIRPIQYLRGIIPYIFYHHERWDGKGYPSGIRGEEIPLGARIIALADVFQALTSDRPYRKAFTNKKAIQIIKDGAGTQFDPKIVNVFLKILQKEK